MYRFFLTEISTIFAVEEQWVSIRKCVLFVVLDSFFSALGSCPVLILFQCQHGRQCHFYYFATLWLCEHLRVPRHCDLPWNWNSDRRHPCCVTSLLIYGSEVCVRVSPWPALKHWAKVADNVTANARFRAKDVDSDSDKTPWSEIKLS